MIGGFLQEYWQSMVRLEAILGDLAQEWLSSICERLDISVADTLNLENSLVDHLDVTLQKTEELATSFDMKTDIVKRATRCFKI